MTTAQRVQDRLSRAPASADAVASDLGITPNAAWIAMRTLRERGLIELVETRGRSRIYAARTTPTETTGRYRPQELYGTETCELAKCWKGVTATVDWNACADSLPDDDTTVMLAMADGEVTTGWREDGRWHDIGAWPYEDAQVTHWAHVPAHPGESA